MGYIYKITNDINNKVYVGKTLHSTIEERFKEHCNDSKKKRNEKRPLYNAMRKYGIEHFQISLIGEYSDEELSEMEIYWIAYYKGYEDGYNATKGGEGKPLFDHSAIKQRLLECPYPVLVAREFNCCVDIVRDIAKTNQIQIKNLGIEIGKQNSKPVYRLDKQTEVILEYYASLAAAAEWCVNNKLAASGEKSIRGHVQHIKAVCDNKRKSAYGYKWVFITDLDKS